MKKNLVFTIILIIILSITTTSLAVVPYSDAGYMDSFIGVWTNTNNSVFDDNHYLLLVIYYNDTLESFVGRIIRCDNISNNMYRMTSDYHEYILTLDTFDYSLYFTETGNEVAYKMKRGVYFDEYIRNHVFQHSDGSWYLNLGEYKEETESSNKMVLYSIGTSERFDLEKIFPE